MEHDEGKLRVKKYKLLFLSLCDVCSYRAKSLFLGLGAHVLPVVNFWAHCQNFRLMVNSFAERHMSKAGLHSHLSVEFFAKLKRFWDGMETLSPEFGENARENDK